jgi:hypothetical protein
VCAGCGVHIPPAGSFGPTSGMTGSGIPPEGSFGPLRGAGPVSTDTRLGGSEPAGAAGMYPNMLDWQKHPIVWLLFLVFVILVARRVMA